MKDLRRSEHCAILLNFNDGRTAIGIWAELGSTLNSNILVF